MVSLVLAAGHSEGESPANGRQIPLPTMGLLTGLMKAPAHIRCFLGVTLGKTLP